MHKILGLKENNWLFLILLVVVILVIGSGGFLITEIQSLKKENSQLSQSLLVVRGELQVNEEARLSLTENLNQEKTKNNAFENQIQRIAGTVGSLEKLSKTDKELLQKYSKVYFLNENYIPGSLSDMAEKYLYDKKKSEQIHTQVLPFINDLLEAASKDGVDFKVVSAYRSFGTQAGLKAQYNKIYGAGTANQFSADQGYSEHQLGTTLDLTVEGLSGVFAGFDKTAGYEWLLKNAYRYGFILSYPANNSYYQFEPWHWRFVGTDLATKLFEDKKNFYDLDQRELDPYLISIFD